MQLEKYRKMDFSILRIGMIIGYNSTPLKGEKP